MTDDEARTCLLLGMKIKRVRWKGHICIINGELNKYNPRNQKYYRSIEFSNWASIQAEEEFGTWEIVK